MGKGSVYGGGTRQDFRTQDLPLSRNPKEMSTKQVGTGLGNEYVISGMLWPIPCLVHSSRPYNLYQDHYKSILVVLLLSRVSPHPQEPLFSSLTPILGSLLLELASLFLVVLTRTLALMSGWVGCSAPDFSSFSHSSVNKGSCYMGSADCLTNWPYCLFSLVCGFYVSLLPHLFLGQHQGRELESRKSLSATYSNPLVTAVTNTLEHNLPHPVEPNVSVPLASPLHLSIQPAPLETSITSVQHQRITGARRV